MVGTPDDTRTSDEPVPLIRQRVFGWRGAVLGAEHLGAAEGCNAATVKLVALALSLYMSERGDSCFPSLVRLAADCSLGKATVVRAIGRLEALGFLVVERGGGRGHPSYYFAVVPEAVALEPPVDNPVKGPPRRERVHERSVKGPRVKPEEPLTSTENSARRPQPTEPQRPTPPRFVPDETPVDPAANLSRLADVRRKVIADPKESAPPPANSG